MTITQRRWGEAGAGLVACTLGLTEALAYAAVVFAPLGASFSPAAMVAGLTGLCLLNVVGAMRPGSAAIVSGPYSLAAVLLAAALSSFLQAGADAAQAVALLMLVVLLSGLMQVGLGLFKLGDLGRFIPQPVIAGLLNGSSLLILSAQVNPILGLEQAHWLQENAGDFVEPWTLTTAVVTIGVTLLCARLRPALPAPLAGVAAGTLAHYGLAPLVGSVALGSVVGNVPRDLPLPEFGPRIWAVLAGDPRWLAHTLPLAAGVALVISIRSLISAVALDHRLGSRTDRNGELLDQGMGNAVAGLFGGISGAGSVALTVASREFGGRTRLTRASTGIFALAILLALAPAVGRLPGAVLSAALVLLCLRAFDRWSLLLLGRFLSGSGQTRAAGADLMVMLTVTGVLIGVGTFEAVAVGVVISVSLLLHRMGKEVIRRELRGGAIYSNVHRGDAELQVLAEHGAHIRILELEGSLFFGTADILVERVDQSLAQGCRCLGLDLKHVGSVDSTGGYALLRIQQNCATAGVRLMFSGLDGHSLDVALLHSLGVLRSAGDSSRFRDMDGALAHAEDWLLDEQLGSDRYRDRLPLRDVEALAALADNELPQLEAFLQEAVYTDAGWVCRQGDSGDQVHFILSGRAQVVFQPAHSEDEVVLGTLCPGTMFGEMSILDGRPRSASIRAEGSLHCRVLSLEAFQRLQLERPDLGLALLRGMGRELSKRIRIGNRIASELRG